MADTSNLEFGRVLESGSSDRKIWFLIIPAVLALAALLAFAGMALSRTGSMESKVRLAEQQVQEANKAVDERDNLLKKARADEAVLRSAGQGAAVMAAAQRDSPASGVALVHPEQKAVKLFAFGLKQPEQGQEYRVEALTPDKKRTPLGTIVPDDRGTAFLLAKDLPEGASAIEVVLANASGASPDAAANGGANTADKATDAKKADAGPAQADEGGTLVMVGEFPKPGTAGVVQAPDPSTFQAQTQAQARTPRHAARRRAR